MIKVGQIYTKDDIDFKEKANVKNEMTRLFKLEENFI